MKAPVYLRGAFYHNFKNKDELGVLVVKAGLHTRIYEAMTSPLYVEDTEAYDPGRHVAADIPFIA
ncbi:MAG: hypothetical protein R6U03_07915 [Gillisia sp.]